MRIEIEKYKLVFVSLLIVFTICYLIFDVFQERPLYYEKYSGKIISVNYNLGNGRPTFTLDDSTKIYPGGEICNYMVNDSVFKDKNTYTIEYFRKDNSNQYKRLTIIQKIDGSQKLEFEK